MRSRSSLLTVVAGAVVVLGYAIFAVLTTRWLDPEDRGLLLLGMTAGGLTTVLASLGLTVRGRSDLSNGIVSPSAYGRATVASAALHLPFSLFIGAGLAWTLRAPITLFTSFLVTYGTLNLIGFLTKEGAMGEGKITASVALEASYVSILILGTICLRVVGPLALPRVMGWVVIATAGYAFTQSMLLQNPRHWVQRPARKNWAYLFGSWRSLSFFMSEYALTRWDRLVVGLMLGPSGAAFYGTAATYGQLSTIVLAGGRQIYYRRISQGLKLSSRTALWLGAVVASSSLVLALLAPWLVPTLFGKEYAVVVNAGAVASGLGLLGAWYILRRTAAAYQLRNCSAALAAILGLATFALASFALFPVLSWVGLVIAWGGSALVAALLLGSPGKAMVQDAAQGIGR